MNWLKKAQKKLIGYKIVAFNGQQAYSIYDHKITINLTIGSFSPNKTYLGTSKQFCLDYYTGGTDDQDLLLTYEFNEQDVIQGDPFHHNGEIIAKNTTLLNVEEVN